MLSAARWQSFPHACGDGPSLSRLAELGTGFPHACGDGPVPSIDLRHSQSFPHACGDGPVYTMLQTVLLTFSPRVWGWSVGTGIS